MYVQSVVCMQINSSPEKHCQHQARDPSERVTYLQKPRDEVIWQFRRWIFLRPEVLHHVFQLLPVIQRFL
jgi:hypothetical protein